MIAHILRDSLERDWVVTIIYHKENEITKRNIKVLEMGESTVKAYCFLRKQYRVFNLDFILAAAYYKPKIMSNL